MADDVSCRNTRAASMSKHQLEQNSPAKSEIREGRGALSDAELDKASGGMDVQIGQVSSNITTTDSGAGLGPGLLQRLVSSIVDGINQARRPH
jgi:hypothetical protein